MSAPEIPASITEVTPAWLSDVLRDAGVLPAGAVQAVTVDQIGVGVGIMGELFRVGADYGAGGPPPGAPSSVVVKLPSPFEANRAQGVGLGMYEAEVRFYRELAPHTAARTARCYHADIVPGTARFVVVLEDLSGLEMADYVAGMTVEECRAAARALAAVHGSWWGKVDAPAYAWIPSVVHPRIEMLAGMWPALWEGFLANFATRLPEGGRAGGEAIRDHYWELMQAMSRLPWTLIHQDYRSDNLLFERDLDRDDAVVILDWQGIGRGPAAYDLAYLLGGSLTVADRRASERAIMADYHRHLVGAGVTDYPAEQLWHDYRLALLVAGPATAVLTGATFDLANERGGQMIGAMTERHFSALVDHDSVSLIP